MFSDVRRLFGNINVKQKGNVIHVNGVPADLMAADIKRIWNTSRINSHMFIKLSRSGFSIPAFFIPDLVYMIDTMINNRKRGTRVRSLTNLRNHLIENTWLKQTEDEETKPRLDLSKLSNLNYRPLDYQQAFLEHYNKVVDRYNLRGYLLAAAAGSGKTAINLFIGEALQADTVVIICPKNATIRVWEKEIISVYKKPQSYYIHQYGKPYEGQRFCVFHYEALDTALELADTIRKNGRVFVALDESHNLNEISSQRTNKFIELCKRLDTRDVIFASGTAIKALGAEAIPLLRVIDPYFDDDAEQRFKKIFGREGSKGLDILKARIGLVSFKVEKSELKLAAPTMHSTPVVMPNASDYTLPAIRDAMTAFINERMAYYKSRKADDERFFNQCIDIHRETLSRSRKGELDEYLRTVKMLSRLNDVRHVADQIQFTNRYEKNVILPSLPKEMREQFKEVKTIIKYVALKIQGEALGRVLGRKRIECHVDMVPYVPFKEICESTAKKTLVFTSFVEALEKMQEYLITQDMKPLVVYGKTNNELNQTVARFEKDENLNPLVATYNSLSTAVPLVMADTMIMLNSPFRAYIHEQAISRIHRLGADTQTHVHQAFLDTGNVPNISTRSVDILKWSQEQVEAILGVKSPFTPDIGQEGITEEIDFATFDESQVILDYLNRGFEQFDFELDRTDFDTKRIATDRVKHQFSIDLTSW